MKEFILYAASAAAYGFDTSHEIGRSTSRTELEARKRELDAADTAAGKYSTVRWVEAAR